MPDNGNRLDRVESLLEQTAEGLTRLEEQLRIHAIGANDRMTRLEEQLRTHATESNDRMTRLETRLYSHATDANERASRLEEGHRELLTWHVLMGDSLNQLTERVTQLGARVDRYIDEHQREHAEIDERFTALMRMMDEWVRRNPPQ